MSVPTITLIVISFSVLASIPAVLPLSEAFQEVTFSQRVENSLRVCLNFLYYLEIFAPSPSLSVLETVAGCKVWWIWRTGYKSHVVTTWACPLSWWKSWFPLAHWFHLNYSTTVFSDNARHSLNRLWRWTGHWSTWTSIDVLSPFKPAKLLKCLGTTLGQLL